MGSSYFNGNQGYVLEATAGRSGRDIYVDVTVVRVGSFVAYNFYDSPWVVNIAGAQQSFNWTYDFRNTTRIYLGRVWRYGLSPGSHGWSAQVNMGNGIGQAVVSGETIDIPFDAPAAPTLNSLVRNSDTSATLTWTRRATSQAAYAYQVVQRKHRTGNSSGQWVWTDWVNVAVLNTAYSDNAVQSFTDTGLVPNNLFYYRVVAANGSGTVASPDTGWLFTTPAAPEVSLALQSNGTVTATVVTKATHTEHNTELQYSSGGGAWTALTTLGRNAFTYNWSPPAAASIRVRARAVINAPGAQGNGLASGYTESNLVPLQVAPAAPTGLTPTGINVDRTLPTIVKWQHNSLDTSDQTAYQVGYRVNGGTFVELAKVTTSSKQHTFAANLFASGANIEWAVRTWGALASTPSPYSAFATFGARTKPTVTITAPIGSADTSRATVVWNVVANQSAWEAALYVNGGALLEQRSGNGTGTSVQFNTLLTDGASYAADVRVRNSDGLWSSWTRVTFVADFPIPLAPSITVSWEKDRGAVLAFIGNPDEVGTGAAVTNSLLRSYDGVEWELLYWDIPLDGTVADPEPKLNATVYYKARATSALDTSTDSIVVTIVTTSSMGYWSAGADFYSTLRVRMDVGQGPGVNLKTGLVYKERHYFAGRTLPVEYVGVEEATTGSVSFSVDTIDEREQALRMARMPAPHLVRHQDGTLLYVSIDDVSVDRIGRGLYQIGLSFVEVER